MNTIIANAFPICIGLGVAHLGLSVALYGLELDSFTVVIVVLCIAWWVLSFMPGLNVVMALLASVLLMLRFIGLLHNKFNYGRWTF